MAITGITSSAEMEIRKVAGAIPQRPSWRQHGKKIEQIVGLTVADLRAQNKRVSQKAATERATAILLDLDETLGWDWPDQGEDVEDAFLAFVAERKVAALFS